MQPAKQVAKKVSIAHQPNHLFTYKSRRKPFKKIHKSPQKPLKNTPSSPLSPPLTFPHQGKNPRQVHSTVQVHLCTCLVSAASLGMIYSFIRGIRATERARGVPVHRCRLHSLGGALHSRCSRAYVHAHVLVHTIIG